MTDDFTEFLRGRDAIGQAYISGDPAPLVAASTQNDPATFYPPSGGHVQGADAVVETNVKGAESFAPGGETHFEILHSASSGDLGYLVAVQHASVHFDGKDEAVPMHLRITELFRREDGEWRLVHRHADPHADPETGD